jgi:hypothetical protein
MANTDNPRGLRPVRGNNDGGPRVTLYPGGTTTSIGRGDVVALATNGRVHRIATTTGSARIIGVAQNYVAAPATGVTTAPDVYVYDDPSQLFEIQDDGAAATPAQSSIGATYPLVLGTPNTTTGSSIQELDISAPGTTSTDPLLAVGFVQGQGREIGKNACFIVRLNRHLFKTGSAGI